MDLSDRELRVLGCLIEKEMTTPDYYPMTANALLAACNQKSNRSPVVEYSETEVVEAVDRLRERGLARTVHGKGDRALKYRHVAPDILKVSARQVALLAVLMLRGPQTLGELRTRTGRYAEFADLDEVNAELAALAAAEEPRVEQLARRPGEKESRYRHLLGGEDPADRDEISVADDVAGDGVADADRVGELESELAELRERVARMERELGLDL
ncbi:MAG: YceH family protein [Actinomycetota bacterium]|nr:YceH family protein [Actinomycetota bacterium]